MAEVVEDNRDKEHNTCYAGRPDPIFDGASPPYVAAPNFVAPSHWKTGKRMVVIDGSNVAMTHGLGAFSWPGIDICVRLFVERGHKNVVAIVPQSKTDFQPYSPNPARDRFIIEKLRRGNNLRETPDRKIPQANGTVTREAAYDDPFILSLASEYDGVVVSNDFYRDCFNMDPAFQKIIQERVIGYMFYGNTLMLPSDTRGRRSEISLEQLLDRDALPRPFAAPITITVQEYEQPEPPPVRVLPPPYPLPPQHIPPFFVQNSLIPTCYPRSAVVEQQIPSPRSSFVPRHRGPQPISRPVWHPPPPPPPPPAPVRTLNPLPVKRTISPVPPRAPTILAVQPTVTGGRKRKRRRTHERKKKKVQDAALLNRLQACTQEDDESSASDAGTVELDQPKASTSQVSEVKSTKEVEKAVSADMQKMKDKLYSFLDEETTVLPPMTLCVAGRLGEPLRFLCLLCVREFTRESHLEGHLNTSSHYVNLMIRNETLRQFRTERYEMLRKGDGRKKREEKKKARAMADLMSSGGADKTAKSSGGESATSVSIPSDT